MKKKQPEAKPRLRRTKVEMSAGFSHQHLKYIKRISAMSRVDYNRVRSDVIEIGIAAVMEQYKPLIEMEEMRGHRSESLKRLLFNGEKNYEHENVEATGPGITEAHGLVNVGEDESTFQNSGIPDGVASEEPTIYLDRPVDDAFGSGLGSETVEAIGSDNTESGTLLGE